MDRTLNGQAVIVGIGQTDFTKNSGRSELQLAVECVKAAIDDAGLSVNDIDGMSAFTLDTSDERVNAKIKVGAEMKIPYLVVVGGRDEEAGTVSVRKRGVGDIGATPLEEFAAEVESEARERRSFEASKAE